MMTHIQGFVVPVPVSNKSAYFDMAWKIAPIFAEYGALRTVECWGDDVMAGKVTDFNKAVQATSDEAVVLAWVLWPDKATCDTAAAKIMADERIKPEMPFDGKRMIYGGFEAVFDTGDSGKFGYVDGMVASVPNSSRQAFLEHASQVTQLFKEKGALRVVDGWGTDVPAGKLTDFQRAVQAKDDETVIFAWIEWPDKATRNAGMAALMDDPRMRAIKPSWNGSLAIFAGFQPVLDTDHA
jgi:uncharacterized protein YbaA (DUF1428 family)